VIRDPGKVKPIVNVKCLFFADALLTKFYNLCCDICSVIEYNLSAATVALRSERSRITSASEDVLKRTHYSGLESKMATVAGGCLFADVLLYVH